MGLCLDIYSRSQEGKVVDLWSLGKIVWNTNVFLINELFDYSIPPGKPNGRPKFWRSACSNKFIIRVFLSSATGSFSLQSLKSRICLTRSLIDWEVDCIVVIMGNRNWIYPLTNAALMWFLFTFFSFFYVLFLIELGPLESCDVSICNWLLSLSTLVTGDLFLEFQDICVYT